MLSFKKVQTRHNVKTIGAKGKSRKKAQATSTETDLADSISDLHVTTPVKKINPDRFYVSNLLASRRYFQLSRRGQFGIADANEDGSLAKKYCIVGTYEFTDDLQTERLLVCSCPQAVESSDRIAALDPYVESSHLLDFVNDERRAYCIHRRAIEHLPLQCYEAEHDIDDADDDCDESSIEVDQLSIDPLLVAVFCDGMYGIVESAPNINIGLKCVTCKSSVTRCQHIFAYRSWARDNGMEVESELAYHGIGNQRTSGSYTCISYTKIPYPLTTKLQRVYDQYEEHKRDFPRNLIPSIGEDDTCAHGNKWDSRCPVANAWIQSTSVKIHKLHSTINSDDGASRTVYYRPSVGDCSCRCFYDGQDDLLLNVDNKNFVYYDVLCHFLNAMVHTGMPLSGLHKTVTATNANLSSAMSIIPLYLMRRAWNCYARLLDLDFTKLYTCPQCGTAPVVVICDATDVGVRKDLLPFIVNETKTNTPVVIGSRHQDRVFFSNAAIRRSIRKLCGVQEKRRKRVRKGGLKASELSKLQRDLAGSGHATTAQIISKYCTPGKLMPEPFASMFAELSRSSPVCGIFQVAGIKLVHDTLCRVHDGLDVRQVKNASDLTTLQKYCPVMAEFLSSVEELTQEVRSLVKEISTAVEIPTKKTKMPATSSYGSVKDSYLNEYFPSLDRKCADAVYEADNRNQPKDNECRKESWGHQVLSPGIFTVYCEHGICYGFTLMKSFESPRHPFQIFRTRFNTAPRVVVYDNACKLHQYVLNREPHYFKNTIFMVDRFHWKGHTACSEGYNMSNYKSLLDINKVNSQVNEQENAGIQRLKGHLSYMRPDNFMFHVGLYYAMRNLHKSKLL